MPDTPPVPADRATVREQRPPVLTVVLHSLRGRLILLMLLAGLPAFVIQLYANFWLWQQAVHHVEDHLLNQARVLVVQHEEQVEDVRRRLAALAEAPALATPAGCAAGIAAQQRNAPPYLANLLAILPDGRVSCIARGNAAELTAADRPYFRRALGTAGFLGGDYIVSRATGEPVVMFTHTVWRDGGVALVLGGSINFSWLRQHPQFTELPAGAAYTLYDQGGTAVLQHPQKGRQTPAAEAAPALWQKITSLHAAATFRSRDGSGVERLFGHMPFGPAAMPYGRLVVSIPVGSAYAEADRVFQLMLLQLAVACILGLLAGWIGGRELVLQPLRPIFATVRRVAGGDFAARTGVPASHGNEIGQLANELDRMAASLAAEIGERQRAELAARQGLERAQAYLDIVSVMVVALDHEGRITLVNRRACEVLGCASGGSCLGGNWFDVHTPAEGRDTLRAVFLRLMSGEIEPVRYHESEVLAAAGERRLIAWHNNVLRDAGGRITGTLSAGEDITARRQAEIRLRESEGRYRSLFDNMLEGFAHCRLIEEGGEPPDFVYLDVNAAFGRLTGLTEVVGRRASEVIPGIHEANPELLAIYRRVVASGRPERFESHVKALDIWLSVAAYRAGSDSFIAVFDNITESRRAEEHLRATRQMLQLVTDTIPDRVFWKDRDSRYLGCNAAFARDAGVADSQDIVGKSDHDLVWHGQAELYRQDDAEVMQAGVARLDYVEPQTDGDGSRIWLETSKVPLRDAGGEVIGVLGVYRDITRRRQLEDERERLQGKLQQAQKMEALGQLTGGIAHDFNNILTSMLGFSRLALARHAPDPDGPLAEYLNEVIASGERARSLIAKMLTFSRAVPASVARPLAVAPVVRETLQMLASLIPSSIEIESRAEDDVPQVVIDPVDLQQILINLIVNARDAIAGRGKITIALARVQLERETCAACRGDIAGNWVALSVADTGEGIPAEVLPRIFDPFFTTKEFGKGTGMGLAVVHGLVFGSGRHILVRSRLGEGSVFQVLFPPAPAADAAMPAVATAAGSLLSAPPARGARVMVVDDDAAVCHFVKEVAAVAGCSVTAFGDPLRALHTFRQAPAAWDAVITDQTMPGLTGTELMLSMRELRPELPVILCTGHSDMLDQAMALHLGARGFLLKPMSPDDLLAALGALAGQA